VDDRHFCEECGWTEYDERDNGPTGHGDVCHSDADPDFKEIPTMNRKDVYEIITERFWP